MTATPSSPTRRRAGRAAVAHFASGTATAPSYWVHLDVDVLDMTAFPATDYLMPNGLDLDQLAGVLQPLTQHPAMIGFSLGCYNPSKDPTAGTATRSPTCSSRSSALGLTPRDQVVDEGQLGDQLR